MRLSGRMKVIVSIVCIGATGVFGAAYLFAKSAAHNLSGICDSKSRVLSDDEFINAAIAYELDYDKEQERAPIRHYDSVEQFRQINTHCCEVKRKIMDDGFPPFSHAFGTYYADVTVTYRRSGNELYRATIWLGRCGSPGERFGTNAR